MREHDLAVEAVTVRSGVRKHCVGNLILVVAVKRCSTSGALLLVAHDDSLRRECRSAVRTHRLLLSLVAESVGHRVGELRRAKPRRDAREKGRYGTTKDGP